MELNMIEGPLEEEIKSSEDLFQQFVMNFIESRKKIKLYEKLESVVEKDSVYFIDGARRKRSYIQHEEKLSADLQKQLNDSVFVIRFQNNENKMVYRVLQGNGNVLRGVSFTNEGNGVVLYRPGTLTREMEFVTYQLNNINTYNRIVGGFQKAISNHPSFRLHVVTGNLRFEKM